MNTHILIIKQLFPVRQFTGVILSMNHGLLGNNHVQQSTTFNIID